MSAGILHRLRRGYESATDAGLLELSGGTIWSYGDIDLLSGRIAQRLVSAGAAPGERVMVQVGKSPEAVALYLACLRTGAIYVPLNPAYTSGEVAGFVADCDPAVVVCAPSREADHRERSVFTLDASGSGSLFGGIDELEPLDPVDVDPEDTAAMLYTSGTTGRSKGAMLSHRALIANAEVLQATWGITSSDVLVHALPVFHTHGLFVALHTVMLCGARVRFLPRFDVDEVLAALPGATVMMGVPTYYLRLMASGRLTRDLATGMRLFISGSAPLSSDASDRFFELTGHRILERYGMTEAGMITSNPLDGERVAGTVGYPLAGYETRVRDEAGHVAAPGTAGVLEIKGPHLFSGYWGMPERTAEEHVDGYFHTGDLVVADDDGRITIVGRASDVVITGGLNVYPREVEQAIDDVPGVVESAVVGLPDPDLGESVTAFVVCDEAVTEAALHSALAEQLAGFKRPRAYVFVPELPKNAMGKVQKSRLRG